MKKLPVRLINDDEKHFAEIFQYIVKLTLDTFKVKGWTGSNLEQYKKFKKELKRFSNYPFMVPLIKKIREWDNELISLFQSKRHVAQKNSEIKTLSTELMTLFMNGSIDEAYNYSLSVKQFIDSTKNRRNDIDDIIGAKRNPLYIENPLFFGRNGLLDQFTKEDMIELIKIDLNINKWTYMPLPENKIQDFEFIVHWIQQLQSSSDPIEISSSIYSKYAEYAYSSVDFDRLKNLLKTYLHENDKSIIPQIINQINKIPDLAKTNDDQKLKISTVFRGIAVDETTTKKDIKTQELQNKYVATSLSQRVAKRFSYQIGHLENEKNRRSDYGAVITYEVNYDSIILDTNILGGIFGESEIIIDVSKSKIIDIEMNYKEDDYDDY
jgi:hypothetical protein